MSFNNYVYHETLCYLYIYIYIYILVCKSLYIYMYVCIVKSYLCMYRKYEYLRSKSNGIDA